MSYLAMAALAVPTSCAVTPSCFRSPLSPGLATHRVSVSIGPTTVKLARLVWNGQRGCKQRTEASLNVAAAKVDVQTEEEAGPAVTTESVPRPKKIGKGIVRLRLSRLGRKKRPFYRIVATHSTWRRDGKYIELLGHYNPLHAKDDLGVVVKADRIKYWLGVGAQPSDTVTGILYKVGILKAENPV